MLTRFLAYADKYHMLPDPGEGVLAAVSGGADSVCMLFLLAEAAKERGFLLRAAHFDHMLRGAESRRDAEFTENLCRDRGIPCVTGRGDVAAFAAERGLGCEEAGRILRYGFLRRAMAESGCVRIATAHSADDNAETVLMRLARGAGTRGLSGIPPVRGEIIRPLLWATRAEIEAWLRERGIPHTEDSTNALDLYARNRVRQKVVPVLRELNPRFAESVSAAAELLREDDRCLQDMADAFLSGKSRAEAKALAALPRAVASRAVRALAPVPQDRAHVDALLDACREGRDTELGMHGCRAVIEGGSLRFVTGSSPVPEAVSLAPGENRYPGFTVRLGEGIADGRIHKSFTTFLFKKDSVCGTISVRPRRPGDSIRLRGRGVTKSLKKLYNEAHIPRGLRDTVPVAADESGVLAVWSLGADERGAPEPGDPVWIIEFEGEINA